MSEVPYRNALPGSRQWLCHKRRYAQRHGRPVQTGLPGPGHPDWPAVFEHFRISGRIHHRCHPDKVFGCGPDHGRASDVNISPGIFQSGTDDGNGFTKRIEVDHHHIYGPGTGTFQIRLVGRIIGFRQKAQIDLEIQGFHQSPLGFRLAGIIGYLLQVAGGPVTKYLFNPPEGTAGGQDDKLRIQGNHARDQGLQTGFV
jgi:hypothetical protein